MNKLIFYVVGLLLVIGLAITIDAQEPPPTPTPAIDGEDLDDLDNQSLNYEATAQALQDENVTTTNGENQIYYDGEPILPDFSSPMLQLGISYAKYLLATDTSKRIFGPFSPIIVRIRILLYIVLIWTSFFFLYQAIVSFIRVVMWILKWILKFIELIPFQ